MKISVIVPVYNVEEYLKKCLNSIVEQNYRDLEILLIDDGSTDNSVRICEEFAAKDERILLIRQCNGGVSVTRNTGIENATGEYIAFVDSDDWLDKEMYQNMVSQILKNPNLDMVMCDSTLIKEDSEIKSTDFIRAGMYLKNHIVAELYPFLLVTENFGKIPVVSPCTSLIKRSVLMDHHIRFDPDLRYSEDYLFMAKIVININSFFYFKGRHYYNYRQYQESRSKKFQSDWWNVFLDLNKKLTELLVDSKEFNFTRQIKLQLIHSALFVTNSVINNDILRRDEKLQLLKKLFNDPKLKMAFFDLKFNQQNLSLKIGLNLMKYRMPQIYSIYRAVVSKIKS